MSMNVLPFLAQILYMGDFCATYWIVKGFAKRLCFVFKSLFWQAKGPILCWVSAMLYRFNWGLLRLSFVSEAVSY